MDAYEAYEVKKKMGKITLPFTSPEKDFFLFIFMKSFHGNCFKNGPLFH